MSFVGQDGFARLLQVENDDLPYDLEFLFPEEALSLKGWTVVTVR